MHVTIATLPTSDLSVAAEVRLVKAALLYAERVTLASGNAAMLDAARRLVEGRDSDRARKLMQVTMVMMEPELQRLMTVMLSRKARRGFKGYAEFERTIASNVAEVEELVSQIRTTSGMRELEVAVDAGVLTIDSFELDPVRLTQESVLAALGKPGNKLGARVVDTFVQRVGSAVATGSGTYPLFDKGTSELVELMISEGKVENPNGRPAGEMALAGRYVGYMPAFPDATVEEVLDVRRGLEKPLIRFRGAMATMAGELEPKAWDRAFAAEADRLYQAEVAPALLELEENARELGAFALLREATLSGQPWAALGGGMGIMLAAASAVPDIAETALRIGIPASLSVAIVAGTAEAVKKAMRHERIAEQNRFVFLTRADADLKKRR